MLAISQSTQATRSFNDERPVTKQAPPADGYRLVTNATDRSISIVRHEDGSVDVSMQPPPATKLVLSGGGAKGVAYSGFVNALENMDVLKCIRTISGSSAGAISAALLASGINHKVFDQISDHVPLISLLNSAKPDVSASQDEWSKWGEKLKKVPLAQLLCDLWPRLGSKGIPLENLIREKSCKAFLQRCKEHPGPLSAAAQQAVANVENNRYVTFADLAVLSQEIPQIKTVEITGTALFEKSAQLVVFSAELTPDMDIAVAAHISASLPVVFSKPTQQELPFQQSDENRTETTAFADGGILNNTPIPALYNPHSSMSPIPDGEHLILVFDADEPGKQSQRATGLSALTDRFLKAPHTASSALNAEQMKHFADQIVTVPLNTDKGDFRGLLNGTVNFRMSKDIKNHLQEELRKVVQTHLDTRSATQQTFWFASTEDALLALSDETLAQLSAELEHDQACTEVIAFRQLAQQALAQLKQAIQEANDTSTRLEPSPQIHMAIWALDQLADRPGKLEWLAKRLNHGNDPDFMQFLQAAARWDTGASSGVSEVTRQAVEEMKLHDLATRVDNVVRYVLYPSLFRGGQPESNIKLLNGAIRDLNEVRSQEAFNSALDRVIANYKSRYTGLPNPESTTRNSLLAMKYPEQKA
ncbi:patatin-like phospholipase family protein [Pseudomonas citri]|uniref:patatin-like phospholipase family protein n=1 Tax=Pseudomonas citri TaxID=2978349 RepID=UPI0021B6C3D0|nr:patatin-like phospholipase family protein [Pseudomonas citri]